MICSFFLLKRYIAITFNVPILTKSFHSNKRFFIADFLEKKEIKILSELYSSSAIETSNQQYFFFERAAVEKEQETDN